MVILANVVDVVSKKIGFCEVCIESNRVASVNCLGDMRDGFPFLLPGFVDSHIHIESSMLVPSEFSKVAVRTGVVATVSDPHEIANVLGVDGVEFMRKNGEESGFLFFFGVPSCVPAVPFDRAGAILDSRLVREMIESGRYYYLSEMMNFPGVINRDEEVVAKLLAAKENGFKIDGHAPGLSGSELDAYASSGITTDHECMSVAEAEEKIEKGMLIQIREGSAAKNFDSLVEIAKKYPEKVMLCSDDCHPDDLLNDYFVGLVKRALSSGVGLFETLRMSGYNAIKHYNLPVGLLQEGDYADFIMVDNLSEFNVISTYIRGRLVYDRGNVLLPEVKVQQVNNFVENYLEVNDIKVEYDFDGDVDVKVIGVVDGELFTNAEKAKLLVQDNSIQSSVEKDILKIVVLNRYQKAKPAVGFIRGFGLKHGAICSSVSHDSHNVVAVGADDASIVDAINAVVHAKGGLAYANGVDKNLLQLPVAGIMSDRTAEEVACQYRELLDVTHQSGSTLRAPFMTLAFMSLVVIPELKLSDTGLFDVVAFAPTSIFTHGK